MGFDMEDVWLNGFCVSTNLTRGEVEVHRTGPGWFALRASFSIPGVFPPMRNADGDILVDGGVLDNMPVGIMRSLHDGDHGDRGRRRQQARRAGRRAAGLRDRLRLAVAAAADRSRARRARTWPGSSGS